MRERNGGIAVAVCILKAFVDSVWYLAFMTPFLLRAPRAAAIFLISVPSVWAVWIFLNRSRRNFADSSQDSFLFLKAAGGLMACLAAGWLLLLLYRRLTGSWRTAPGEQTGVLQKSQAEEARQRNGSLEGLFQERNVRYYYRKFLKLCRQKGMELEPSMTSEAIAGIALRYWNEDVLKEFQTVYQKARYGVGLEGDKEKKRARELYRRLKEEASGNR